MKTAGDMGHCLETWGVCLLCPLCTKEGCAKASPRFCLLKVMKRNVNICTANEGLQVFVPAHLPCPCPHPFPRAAGMREPGLWAALHCSPSQR